jgi:CBS domain-containing protein
MWERTVESVMTKDVVTAHDSTAFKDLVELMADNNVSGIPIVDHNGRPVGAVSEADTLAKQEYEGGNTRMPPSGVGGPQTTPVPGKRTVRTMTGLAERSGDSGMPLSRVFGPEFASREA